MNSLFTFEAFSAAAKAQEQIAGMTFKDGEPVFTLQSHGQTRELSTKEAISFLAQFEAEKAKSKEQKEFDAGIGWSNHRPPLDSLGSVLERVVSGALTKAIRIQGFGDGRWQEPNSTGVPQITLEFSSTTAAMHPEVAVEVFVKCGNQDAIAGILRAAAKEIDTWDTEHFCNWFEPTGFGTPPVPMGDIDDLPF